MKLLGKTLAMAAAICALSVGAQSTFAQRGGGNFDPAAMQQQIMERMRTAFDVKDDGEWKLISERITAVSDARRATQSTGGMGALFGRGGRGGAGGAPGGAPADANAGGGQQRRGGPGGGTPNPDMEALQKAIDDKAPAEQIKTLLAKVRESRKDADAKLETAQVELKKVLSVRQEAVAVTFGLLK